MHYCGRLWWLVLVAVLLVAVMRAAAMLQPEITCQDGTLSFGCGEGERGGNKLPFSLYTMTRQGNPSHALLLVQTLKPACRRRGRGAIREVASLAFGGGEISDLAKVSKYLSAISIW